MNIETMVSKAPSSLLSTEDIITDTPIVQGQVQSFFESRIEESQKTPPVDRMGGFGVLKDMVVCSSISRVHRIFASPALAKDDIRQMVTLGGEVPAQR
jgi:hypothetical protein